MRIRNTGFNCTWICFMRKQCFFCIHNLLYFFTHKIQCKFSNSSTGIFPTSRVLSGVFQFWKKSFRWKFSSQNVEPLQLTLLVLMFTQSPNMQANGLVLILIFTTGDKTFFLNLIYCCYSYLPFQQGWAKRCSVYNTFLFPKYIMVSLIFTFKRIINAFF